MTNMVTAIGNRMAAPYRNCLLIHECSTTVMASRGRRLADRRGVRGGADEVGSIRSAESPRLAIAAAVGVPLPALLRRRTEGVVRGDARVLGGWPAWGAGRAGGTRDCDAVERRKTAGRLCFCFELRPAPKLQQHAVFTSVQCWPIERDTVFK